MNCSEFQRGLPDFIEGGGTAIQSEHLSSCAVCSDLVKDLKYIAEAAKLLVPMHDPSAKVWDGIEKSLKREGLLRPAGGPVRLEPFLSSSAQRPGFMKWGAAAGFAAIALAFLAYQAASNNHNTAASNSSSRVAVADNSLDPADEQVLSEVSDRAPAMRPSYEKSMHDVNAYIRDAKSEAQRDPSDAGAHQQLMNAYEQKAVLYEMASTAP